VLAAAQLAQANVSQLDDSRQHKLSLLQARGALLDALACLDRVTQVSELDCGSSVRSLRVQVALTTLHCMRYASFVRHH
jgi:hypothetical protein